MVRLCLVGALYKAEGGFLSSASQLSDYMLLLIDVIGRLRGEMLNGVGTGRLIGWNDFAGPHRG